MEYANKYITGKRISKLGLGCATFGREIDKNAAFIMMDYAHEQGITFFDTASAYGAGKSETIVGEWIAANRSISDSKLVATKILPPFDNQSIYNSVSQSLKRLNVEVLDLLYLHKWDIALKNPEVFSSLQTLIAEGKVRALGASNFTSDQFREALNVQKENGFQAFSFVQNNNNLAVSDINDELIRFCSEEDIFIVTYSPLAAGFLTGKHMQGVQPGTRFDIIPGHQDVYFNERAYRRLARLQEVAATTGYSLVDLALAWAIHQPDTDTVLVGGRTPAHIDQALRAMTFNRPDIFLQLEAD